MSDTNATPEIFDPENLAGQTIGGRYLMERCIGRGGMGSVYLASQNNLNRKVVLKVLRTNLVEDSEAIARFEREAQGLSTLQHPNIVTIFDFGRDGNRAFIVMEHVEGETLSRYIRREGPMHAERFTQIAAQILQGIGEAHSIGLLHRDIKPANIMLCERHGHTHFIKILDFGLAKLADGATDVTKEQSLVGSAAFLSPEQIVGLNEIDQRVDVYALGVLFYYILSGKRPFTADNDTALLYKHVHEAPEPLTTALPEGHDIPANIIALVHQCLAKNPRKRPKDANALLDLLVSGSTSSSQLLMPWSQTNIAYSSTPGNSLSMRFDAQTGAPIPEAGDSLNFGQSSQSVSLVRMPDGSLQVVPMGGESDSFSQERSFILTNGQVNKSPVIPILLVLLIAMLAGGGVYLATQNDQSDSIKEGTASAASATSVDDGKKAAEQELASLQTALDKIGENVGNQDFGTARNALKLINSRLQDGAQIGQASSYEASINKHIGGLIAEAQGHQADGKLNEAKSIFVTIKSIDPSHTEANLAYKDLLAEIKANRQALAKAGKTVAEVGTLELYSSPTGALVRIDGKLIAETPLLNHELPPGKYKIRIEAEGFKVWEKRISISIGKDIEHSIDLTPIPKAPVVAAVRRASKKRRSSTAKKEAVKAPTEAPKKPDPPKTTKKSSITTDNLLLPSKKKKDKASEEKGLLKIQ